MMQRQSNLLRSDDFSVKSKGQWVRLLGLRPGKGRVYLRFAFVQIFAILFLIVGIILVFYGEDNLLKMLFKYFLIPLGIGALIFGYFDIFPRKRR